MNTTRRTLVRNTAWTVPAVMVATTAPAFAGTVTATGCVAPVLTSTTAALGSDHAELAGWTTALGALVPTTSVYTSNWTYRPPTVANSTSRWPGWVFESFRDNAQAATTSGAVTTYNTLRTTVAVQAGRTYRFTMPIRGGWGNNDEAAGTSPQFIDVTVASQRVYYASTRGGAHGNKPAGYPWLDTTASAQDNDGTSAFLAPVNVTFDYTATTTGAVPFEIRLGLMPRTRSSQTSNWNVSTDDLMVGVPTVQCV